MTNVQAHFEPPATVMAGSKFEREHALILQAYNRFHEPILAVGFVPSAARVNQAIDWWNRVVIGGEQE